MLSGETVDYGNIKLMFDSMPFTCHLWDSELKMLDCNEASVKLFKVKSKDEFINRFDKFSPEIQPCGTPSRELAVTNLKKAFAEGRSVFPWMHRAADGTLMPCEITAVRVESNDEKFAVAYVIDQSEQNAMTKKLSEALEEAQIANKAKSIFLSNMSHEIRTPMNAVLGMAELLAHESMTETQSDYVSDIIHSAKSLLEIINDILDLSKIESGKFDLNPVDYDLNALIDNIESMFIYVAQKKGLEFKLECGDNLPGCLYGDDLRLRQSLINICGNAVKFTEKGFVKLKITTADSSVVFEIKDTGIGIREEEKIKLFNAFEQADKSKNRNLVGTGLGLSLCKSFITMMGGGIEVESEYGRGSTFTVSIPLVEGDANNIRGEEIGKTNWNISAPDAKILVTDDNEFNLRVACGLLSLIDVIAETADSGGEAIGMIQENDYDIVFMDHMMPGMDGVETVRRIREMGGKFKKIIIIALTANAVGNVRDMFMENGFDDFISKPIDVSELNEIIKKHLPPQKVLLKLRDAEHAAQKMEKDALLRKSAVTFAKENQKTHANIVASLESGDYETAHRIAHTLKSNAGFLGRKKLQEVSFSLELSLQMKPPAYNRAQLDLLKAELNEALIEFMPLLIEAEAAKPASDEPDENRREMMINELELLLKKNDFAASGYVDDLNSAGLGELAGRIDEYDFDGALRILQTLK